VWIDVQERWRQAKREAEGRFVDWLKASSDEVIDPDTIFDCQIKRIHEYKRQLLNVRHCTTSLRHARAQATSKLEAALARDLRGGVEDLLPSSGRDAPAPTAGVDSVWSIAG
jgi:hypothetical protein